MTWVGQYEGFLSPALAWGGLELGELCFWEEFRLLSVTWGRQYEGFLSHALAWGGLELGELCFWEEFRLLSVTWGGQYGGFLSPALAWVVYSWESFLFALGDLGWSVWGAS